MKPSEASSSTPVVKDPHTESETTTFLRTWFLSLDYRSKLAVSLFYRLSREDRTSEEIHDFYLDLINALDLEVREEGLKASPQEVFVTGLVNGADGFFGI